MAENIAQIFKEDQTCPAVGYQSASICVPVTVTPFAETGVTVTKCCGSPVVMPGKNTCGGVKNGSCSFTISQDICVAIPVVFGATATVGDTFVSCNKAASEDICTECAMVSNPIVPVRTIEVVEREGEQ
ncbi:MAG: hypothetical protein RR275_05060 [Lachnospiraceae bacterium]